MRRKAADNLAENLHWVGIRKSDVDGGRYMFASVSDEIRRDYTDGHINALIDYEIKTLANCHPPSEASLRADRSASSFVEATVAPPSNGGVFEIPATVNTNYNAITYPVMGNIATDMCLSEAEGSDWNRFTSQMVHERTHSTYLASRQAVLINKFEPNEAPYAYPTCIGGMKKYRKTLNKETGELKLGPVGEFFEEGLAEYTASQYRAQDFNHPNALLSIASNDGTRRKFPIRYFSFEPYPSQRYSISSSIYPAYALELLSECAGTNLYDLMALSRDPNYEVEAKREIVQAIESVEKGLYRKLRDLPYPNESPEYLQAYDEIIALVKSKLEMQREA